MTQARRFAAFFFGAAVVPSVAGATDRILRAELDLAAPPTAAFEAWATQAGVTTFFAPAARVESRVDGLYEILFFPDNAPGLRGAEGMRVLALDAPRRFAFTWNAPPLIPEIRGQRTMVVVEFAPKGEGRTRMIFTHQGWGDGEAWDRAYDYFDRAWGAVVLPRLVHRFERGPIDWGATPELGPVAPSLKHKLVQEEASPTLQGR